MEDFELELAAWPKGKAKKPKPRGRPAFLVSHHPTHKPKSKPKDKVIKKKPGLLKRLMHIVHPKPKVHRRTRVQIERDKQATQHPSEDKNKTDHPSKDKNKAGQEEVKIDPKSSHRFNELGPKVLRQIHHTFAPLSTLRQHLADKVAHTPDLAVRALGKGLHGAAELLRHTYNTPTKGRKYTKSQQELLHKILKVAGVVAITGAAISMGAPGIYFATPDIMQGVYHAIPGGDGRSGGGNRGASDDEYKVAEEENRRKDEERNKPPEAANPALAPPAIDTKSTIPEENKTALEKEMEKQINDEHKASSFMFPSFKSALAYYGLSADIKSGKTRDWNKLSDKDVVNEFIKLLTAHIRSGNISKQHIAKAAKFKV
jgi:hypothetical protein